MSTYHLLKILLFFKIILHKSLLQLLKNSFSSFGKNIVDFTDLNIKKLNSPKLSIYCISLGLKCKNWRKKYKKELY